MSIAVPAIMTIVLSNVSEVCYVSFSKLVNYSLVKLFGNYTTYTEFCLLFQQIWVYYSQKRKPSLKIVPDVWLMQHEMHTKKIKSAVFAALFLWSRRESNPCPKAYSLSFYECSLFFDIPSAPRE